MATPSSRLAGAVDMLAIQVGLGLLIGFLEGWSVGDAIYFTSLASQSVMATRQALGRALAVAAAGS